MTEPPRLRLTASERSFVLRMRAIQMLQAFTHPISGTRSQLMYLDLCRHDTAVMAVHYGQVQSVNNLLQVFLSPVVSSLSDRYGRKCLFCLGTLGPMTWFIFQPFCTTLFHRKMLEAVAWGVIQAGNWPVFAAARSDVFGDRPELAAQIEAADQSYTSALRFVTPLIGIWLHTRLPLQGPGSRLPFYISCAAVVGSALAMLSTAETLKSANRKPFQLQSANPLANVLLLLRNGPGLRGLTLATTLFFCTNVIWSTHSAFRFGVLGWTVNQSSLAQTALAPIDSISQGVVVVPFLRAAGNRTAFELGLLASAIGYAALGISAFGTNKLSRSLLYFLGLLTLRTLPGACPSASRAMIVKQGISTTNAGRGELNAAYSGLGTIIGVAMPLVWSRMYGFFSTVPAGSTSPWARLGHGGHFFAGGAIMVLAAAICRSVDDRSLAVSSSPVA